MEASRLDHCRVRPWKCEPRLRRRVKRRWKDMLRRKVESKVIRVG